MLGKITPSMATGLIFIMWGVLFAAFLGPMTGSPMIPDNPLSPYTYIPGIMLITVGGIYLAVILTIRAMRR